jgi:hypothetical protein
MNRPVTNPVVLEKTPSPEKMLRYLDNAYTMTRDEQRATAQYIRELIELTAVLSKPAKITLPFQLELWNT